MEGGKALRTPLQVGLAGGGLVEVLKKGTGAAEGGAEASWEEVTGTEEVVQGGVETLKDGQAVTRQERGK